MSRYFVQIHTTRRTGPTNDGVFYDLDTAKLYAELIVEHDYYVTLSQVVRSESPDPILATYSLSSGEHNNGFCMPLVVQAEIIHRLYAYRCTGQLSFTNFNAILQVLHDHTLRYLGPDHMHVDPPKS